jgi:hypothetical protein
MEQIEYITYVGGIKRTYIVTVGEITSDLGDRPVISIIEL